MRVLTLFTILVAAVAGAIGFGRARGGILLYANGCLEYLLDDRTGLELDVTPPLEGRSCGTAFAPNLKHIAYFNEGGLYESALDGSNEHQIAQATLLSYQQTYSPDGRFIAYWTHRRGVQHDLWLVDLSTGAHDQLGTFPLDDRTLVWSPDGTRLAFSVFRRLRTELMVFDVATREARQLTQNRAYDEQPAWSPDGTQLVYTSNLNGIPDLYIIDVETEESRQLTFDVYCNRPTWSPDGRRIVFGSDQSGWFELFSVWTDGSHLRQITNRRSLLPLRPYWVG